jgi:transposase
MPGHGSKLDQVKERAILALLSTHSQAAAAKKAGIGVATLKRWLQLPEFREMYDAASQRFLDQGVAQLAEETMQRRSQPALSP